MKIKLIAMLLFLSGCAPTIKFPKTIEGCEEVKFPCETIADSLSCEATK